MEINCTLLVQIAHFLLGWFIIDRLYFTPALAWLAGQEKKEQLVHDETAAVDAVINRLKHQERLTKQAFIDYCQQHALSEDQVGSVLTTNAVLPGAQDITSGEQPISPELTKQLQEVIVKKVLS